MLLNRHYSSTEFITGLRAIAVLMVFLIHSGGGGLNDYLPFGQRIIDLGKFGVDIFFVISGFTIFYQIFKKSYSFSDFLFIRILRVSIPYFPIIIVLYILNINDVIFDNSWAKIYNNDEISITNLLLHLFYMSYVDERYANSIIGVEWTLSIEVFYYFLLSIMIFKIKNFDMKKNIYKFLVLSIIISLFFHALLKYQVIDSHFVAWLPFKYGYMFLLGGISFFLREEVLLILKSDTVKKLSDFVIIIGLFTLILFLTGIYIYNSYLLNELFFAIWTFIFLIFVSDTSKFSIILNNRVMVFFGSISFSFYLLHVIVLKSDLFNIHILTFAPKFYPNNTQMTLKYSPQKIQHYSSCSHPNCMLNNTKILA